MKPCLSFSPEDKILLKKVYSFAQAKKVKLYLVGGILRDMFLARRKPNPDFDFCLRKNAIRFGKQLARELKAGFVVLDDEHGACRLVKDIGDLAYTLDFTDFRGPTLEKDLFSRDFTINSLALDLEKALTEKDLKPYIINLYRAHDDLKKKIVRVINIKALREDPLRILRAFSLASIFGFKIDKNTLNLIKKEKEGLRKVSPERIRDELFKILDTDHAYDYFCVLDELKILKLLFPETDKMHGIGQGAYHHLDVWQHTLESIKQLELIIKEYSRNKGIKDYLSRVISSQRRRLALIKFGVFLHDIGKPATMRREKGKITFHGHERAGLDIMQDIARRLRLSNEEIYALKKMILCHLRPGYLADNEILTPRAKFRYFRDAKEEALSVLLISLADQRATKGPLTTAISRIRHEKLIKLLIKEYFHREKKVKPLRLINGHDLMKEFGLEPSELIGKVLAELEELQAIGKVKTKEEALKAASKFIRK